MEWKCGRAILVLKEAATVIDGNSELFNGLGILHYFLGNRREAEKNWVFALQLDSGNSEAHKNLEMLNGFR